MSATGQVFIGMFLMAFAVIGINVVVMLFKEKPIVSIGTPEWYERQKKNQREIDYQEALKELDDEFPGGE